jgi:hypothetical protein
MKNQSQPSSTQHPSADTVMHVRFACESGIHKILERRVMLMERVWDWLFIFLQDALLK